MKENKKKNKAQIKEEIRKEYIKVGSQFFKLAITKDENGFEHQVMVKQTRQDLVDRYGYGEDRIDKPYLLVPEFDVFCNIPDNLNTYQREQGNAFNLYQRPTHKPQEGSYEHTMAFLRHIYGEEHLDFGLDYLTILWKHPKQRLPIHCLVSKEQRTGKTTFLDWLGLIFQSECAIISNQDIEGQFNAHYVGKLIIAIDETQLDVEKKRTSERLKYITTSKTVYVNSKGINLARIENYSKIFMNSNNETDFTYIDANDTRYFVRKLSSIKNVQPNFLDSLAGEIPAFLHFLENRKIKHERQDRLWFSPEVYRTSAHQEVIKDTKPKWQRYIDMFIEDCFETFEAEEQLEFSPKDIYEQIHQEYKYIDRPKIIKYLSRELEMEPSPKNKRYKAYNLAQYQNMGDGDELGLGDSIYSQQKVGKPYAFFRKDWIEEDTREKTEIVQKMEVPEDKGTDIPI